MKKNKIINSFLLFTSLVGVLSSCGNETTSSSSSDSNFSESVTASFSVKVKSIGGKELENVTVNLYEGNDIVSSKKTNETGDCEFNVDKKEYTIKLSDLPDGYYLEKEYKINADEDNYEITCLSKVLEGERPSNIASYVEGDLMYDFTVTNTENETITLSELFNTYDMVFINFFYISCSACNLEFPFLEEAYNDYKDDVAVVALSPYDTMNQLTSFKTNKGYSFDVCFDSIFLADDFNVQAYPTSAIVDRYGIIQLIHAGAVTSKEDFTTLFDKYIGDDYVPGNTEDSIGGEDTGVKPDPNKPMPDTKKIEAVINGNGFTNSWYAEQDKELAEYTWPWYIDEDKSAIYSSNAKIANSTASIYTKVHLKENEVFVFDFFASTEEYGDYFYVKVDDVIEYSVSGISDDWQTCYSFIASAEGDYEIGLHYIKDSDSYAGEDTVYIKNVRIIKNSEISESVYIKRHASYSYNSASQRNEKVVDIYFNSSDNYYHVGSINGPILFADIYGEGSTYYDTNSINTMVSEGLFKFGKKDYSDKMEFYATLASNNDYGIVPITEELKEILIDFTSYYYEKANGNKDDYKPYENQWYDICCYYEGYNVDKEFKDPIEGLATFSSLEAELGDQNFVNIDSFVMPRGKLSKFVPTNSGVYKINSISNNNTVAWIFLNDDRDNSMFFESDTGARIYQTGELSTSNYCMYVYLEANTPYYICSGFDDMYETGIIQFNIEYIGKSMSLFTSCSFGPFYYSDDFDVTGDIIAGGIDVALGDDGYYHELKANGELGSLIYCDFEYYSYFNYSINELIAAGYFDLTYDKFEEAEIVGGINYTSTMNAYKNRIITDDGETKGCVPVDERLASILQNFMDVYTFKGVDHSWTKLCYYYKSIGE